MPKTATKKPTKKTEAKKPEVKPVQTKPEVKSAHQKREVVGKVVSDKMTQTVVVEVARFVTHPVYRKRIRRSNKFHAHNLIGAKTGDVVRLTETRPISKTKKWLVAEIVKK